MIYTYTDDPYLSDSVELSTIEKFEEESLQEVIELKIANDHYKGLLIKFSVYKKISGSLLEAEGEAMERKLRYYSKEWDRIYSLAKTNQPDKENSVSTQPFGRS